LHGAPIAPFRVYVHHGKRLAAVSEYARLRSEKDSDVETKKYFYTIAEAQAAFAVGVTRLYELLGDGTLVARKSGATTLIEADSLEAWARSLPRGEFKTHRKERARPAPDEAGSAA